MILIEGDLEGFIEVKNTTMWDASLNHSTGGNKVVVSIEPGWQLKQMQMDLMQLQTEVRAAQSKKNKEELLREVDPRLKEAYEKYLTVYKLVEQTVDELDNSNSG